MMAISSISPSVQLSSYHFCHFFLILYCKAVIIIIYNPYIPFLNCKFFHLLVTIVTVASHSKHWFFMEFIKYVADHIL